MKLPTSLILTTLLPHLASAGPAAVAPRKDGDKCDFNTWNKVSADLRGLFTTSGGLCNDDARAAIRLVFHDCGTWDRSQGSRGGCDGSLVLSPAELGRNENRGLQGIAGKLKALADKYKVSTADMVVFAGSMCSPPLLSLFSRTCFLSCSIFSFLLCLLLCSFDPPPRLRREK
jgi:catalase (peroxidase I)